MLLLARDVAKGGALRDEVRAAGVACEFHAVDLGRPAEVLRAAAAVAAAEPALHCLVHMAGVWSTAKERCEQSDGLEQHFAVNYLAVTLLTEGLLQLLSETATAGATPRGSPSAPSPSRVVAVGSAAVIDIIQGELHLDDLQLEQLSVHCGRGLEADHFDKGRPANAFAFAHSELLLQLWVMHRAALQPQPPTVTYNLCEPGFVDTALTAGSAPGPPDKQPTGAGLFARKGSMTRRPSAPPRTPAVGCEPALHLASAPAMGGLTGRLVDWGRGGALRLHRPTGLDCFPGDKGSFVEVLADPDKGVRLARATDALVAGLRAKYAAAEQPTLTTHLGAIAAVAGLL